MMKAGHFGVVTGTGSRETTLLGNGEVRLGVMILGF